MHFAITVILTLTAALPPAKPISGLLETFKPSKPSFMKGSKSIAAVAPMPVTQPGALVGIHPAQARVIHLENAKSFLYQAQAIDADIAPKLAHFHKQLDNLVSRRHVFLQKLANTNSNSGKRRIKDSIAKNLYEREQLQRDIIDLKRQSNLMHSLARDSLNAATVI